LSPTVLFPWLDTKSAAKYLGCHPDTLRRWRREGCGPRCNKRGKFIRYHVDELDNWIRSLPVAGNPDASLGAKEVS
jgi:hypothetical protein